MPSEVGAASAAIVAGTPVFGLTFSLPGDGRIGFAAAIWPRPRFALPGERELGVAAT